MSRLFLVQMQALLSVLKARGLEKSVERCNIWLADPSLNANHRSHKGKSQNRSSRKKKKKKRKVHDSDDEDQNSEYEDDDEDDDESEDDAGRSPTDCVQPQLVLHFQCHEGPLLLILLPSLGPGPR